MIKNCHLATLKLKPAKYTQQEAWLNYLLYIKHQYREYKVFTDVRDVMPALRFHFLSTLLSISHFNQASATALLQNAPSNVINVRPNGLSSFFVLIKHFGIVDLALLGNLYFQEDRFTPLFSEYPFSIDFADSSSLDCPLKSSIARSLCLVLIDHLPK